MRFLKTVEGLRCCLGIWRQSSVVDYPTIVAIGLVPTMGALHPGHMSLIRRARQENERVLVTIFVNPLQFGPGEDLDAYPRTLEKDLEKCQAAGVDAVFCPLPHTLYQQTFPDSNTLTQVVPPAAMTAHLCGPYRLGHFAGVVTVVAKLFNLIQPNRAYFGRKDAQQLALIKRMVTDLNLSVTVVSCPTVRESDGLAYSSRNQYLSEDQRRAAASLSQSLQIARVAFEAGEQRGQVLIDLVMQALNRMPTIQVQYVQLVHPETMQLLQQIKTVGLLAIAAHIGKTRLIDNILLQSRRPIIAIDGPAGAGKSTVARIVADKLGLLYLDSGAMYRAITWHVLQLGIDPQDAIAVAETLATCRIRLASEPGTNGQVGITRVWVNDQEVTQVIRSPEVTAQVSTVAAQAMVRQILLEQQQAYGTDGGVVMEGRDIGTQVFPAAELKIFLTASVQERARRRQRDLATQNHPTMSLEALEKAIDERDRKDTTRSVAPLRQADDAIKIITDGLSIDEVVAKIVSSYHDRLHERDRLDDN